MVKYVLSAVLVLQFLAVPVFADYVSGYYRSDGTYVQGYNRSDSNSSVRDNYSYKGNSNPYTGENGSNYYRNSPSSEYYGTSGYKSNSNGLNRRNSPYGN